MVQVTGLDHVVLVVSQVETSLAWYRDRLGLAEVRGDEWRRGEAPFPSLRVDEGTIIDLVPEGWGVSGKSSLEASNMDHLCLVVAPCDLEGFAEKEGIDTVGPPLRLFGARGMGTSLYVRDPDGHVVELRYYD